MAQTSSERLKEILHAGGFFQMHDPTPSPKQCELMADNKWGKLKK